MAEALLRAELTRRGAAARVHSAGTFPWGGGATPPAVDVLAERELDLSEHGSRRLTTALVGRADLILTMTRAHWSGVVAHDRSAADRTFLVLELARLARAVGARGDDETVRAWAARVAATRPVPTVPGRGDEEVADPLGEPITAYRDTADRLAAAARTIASLLVPDD